MTNTIARPVVVGLGHDIHLTARQSSRTYCGRAWTAETHDGIDITCPACRKAYANGRHPQMDLAR